MEPVVLKLILVILDQKKSKDVIKAADYGCSIRISVNAGSLKKTLLEKYKKSLA